MTERPPGRHPLAHLHDILQEVMSWDNEHRYHSHLGTVTYGPVVFLLGVGIDLRKIGAKLLHTESDRYVS